MVLAGNKADAHSSMLWNYSAKPFHHHRHNHHHCHHHDHWKSWALHILEQADADETLVPIIVQGGQGGLCKGIAKTVANQNRRVTLPDVQKYCPEGDHQFVECNNLRKEDTMDNKTKSCVGIDMQFWYQLLLKFWLVHTWFFAQVRQRVEYQFVK